MQLFLDIPEANPRRFSTGGPISPTEDGGFSHCVANIGNYTVTGLFVHADPTEKMRTYDAAIVAKNLCGLNMLHHSGRTEWNWQESGEMR